MGPPLEAHVAAGFGTEFTDALLESIEFDSASKTVAARIDWSPASWWTPGTDPFEALTNREFAVLLGLERRLSNKEIGDDLSISHLTVKRHTRSIYAKLEATGCRQAISRARDLGILQRPGT